MNLQRRVDEWAQSHEQLLASTTLLACWFGYAPDPQTLPNLGTDGPGASQIHNLPKKKKKTAASKPLEAGLGEQLVDPTPAHDVPHDFCWNLCATDPARPTGSSRPPAATFTAASNSASSSRRSSGCWTRPSYKLRQRTSPRRLHNSLVVNRMSGPHTCTPLLTWHVLALPSSLAQATLVASSIFGIHNVVPTHTSQFSW